MARGCEPRPLQRFPKCASSGWTMPVLPGSRRQARVPAGGRQFRTHRLAGPHLRRRIPAGDVRELDARAERIPLVVRIRGDAPRLSALREQRHGTRTRNAKSGCGTYPKAAGHRLEGVQGVQGFSAVQGSAQANDRRHLRPLREGGLLADVIWRTHAGEAGGIRSGHGRRGNARTA